MQSSDFSMQGGNSPFDGLSSYQSMSFKQKTESFFLDAKDNFLMERLLSLGEIEERSISSLDFLMQEETKSPLAKIEELMSAAPPRVQSLKFCSLRGPTLPRILEGVAELQSSSMPDKIKSHYLQVQYALFLANKHWGSHRKAVQQYICHQYPAYEAQEILRWITPLENFVDGKKGARFSKTNTNQPYTEIRSATGRRYELLNTPQLEDLTALDQVLPGGQQLSQNNRLILGVGGEGVVRMAREVESQEFFAVKKNMRIACAEREANQLRLVSDVRYFVSLEDAIIVKGSRGCNKAYHLMPYFQMDGFDYIESIGNNSVQASQKHRELWVKEAATQMVEAVCALHALDRYHRDIKPENFLVKVKPGTLLPEKIVLSDFSFSETNRFTDEKCGTLRYMPPEAFQAGWCDSLYHDAFSLGVTLHALYYALYHTQSLGLLAEASSVLEATSHISMPLGISVTLDGSKLSHIVHFLRAQDIVNRKTPAEVRGLPYFLSS